MSLRSVDLAAVNYSVVFYAEYSHRKVNWQPRCYINTMSLLSLPTSLLIVTQLPTSS